jgi:streptomycin 6-kinase
MTRSIHNEDDILQIYFRAIFRETRHYAQAHVTSGALCALSLAARRTRQRKLFGDFAGQFVVATCWGLLLLPIPTIDCLV